MNFTTQETLFRFLFSSPAWFVGAVEREDFSLTVAFPSFDRKGRDSIVTTGPYRKSTCIFSIEVEPPDNNSGTRPMYEWVGEETSALLGAFFGKLIINLGHIQAGKFLTVPSSWDRPCHSYDRTPFNDQPRKPDGLEISLVHAADLMAAYIRCRYVDGQLSLLLRASEFYRMALENYHERPEMAFTLFISTLESLVELKSYTEADLYDEQLLSDLGAIESECKSGKAIVARLKGRLYQVRRKVASLVDAFVPDSFFQQREATGQSLNHAYVPHTTSGAKCYTQVIGEGFGISSITMRAVKLGLGNRLWAMKNLPSYCAAV